MKTLLVIFLILIVAAAVGLSFFVFTFDANQYKPLLVQNLEPLIGNKVKIDGLDLKWSNGIALEVAQFEIYPKNAAAQKPILEIESAAVSVKLLPLLRRDIQVGFLEVSRPRLQIQKNRDGTIQILGINPPEAQTDMTDVAPRAPQSLGPESPLTALKPVRPDSPTGESLKSALPFGFLIKTIRIHDGDITFHDLATAPPSKIHAAHLDLTVKNLSLTRWIDIEAAAALFSIQPNIRMNTRLRLDLESEGIQLERGDLETTLESFDLAELKKSIPALSQLGLQESPKGNVQLHLDHFEMRGERLKDASGKIQIKNGFFALDASTPAADNVNANVEIQKDVIHIRQLTGKILGAEPSQNPGKNSFSLTGNVEEWMTLPKASLQLKLDGLNLEDLVPAQAPNAPQLVGMLGITFNGSLIGASWEQISNSLSGAGNLKLNRGTVINFNLLREIFQKMSLLPGLVDRLKMQLPPVYLQKLNERDTVISAIDQTFNFRNGVLMIDRLNLVTETAELTGTAEVGLNGALAVQTMVFIEPNLSAAMVASVPELQFLTDPTGRVQIPLKISGVFPAIRVFPDLQYLGSRLAAAKTQEFLSGLLGQKKQPLPNQPATAPVPGQPLPQDPSQLPADPQMQTQPAPAPQTAEPFNFKKLKGKDLLGAFLQSALDTSNSNQSAPSDTAPAPAGTPSQQT